MHKFRMHRGIAIGLGAALAAFATGATEADASSCNNGRRACRCAPYPAYSFVPPPNAPIPPNPVYGYRTPRDYPGYRPTGASYDYPPPGYGASRPWVRPTSQYWERPRREYGSYPGPRRRFVSFDDYDDDAPRAYYRRYQPNGWWAQNR
jgi:hypothetical protein